MNKYKHKYKHNTNKGCLWAISLSALCMLTSCKDKDLDVSTSSDSESMLMSETSNQKTQTPNVNSIPGNHIVDSAGNAVTVLGENDEPLIVTAYTGTERGNYNEIEVGVYSEIFKNYVDARNAYELDGDCEALYQIYKEFLSFKYEMTSLLKVYLYDDSTISSEIYAAYRGYTSNTCLNMLRGALLDYGDSWIATEDISQVYYERFMEDLKVYENNTTYPLIHKYLSANTEFMKQYGAYLKGV